MASAKIEELNLDLKELNTILAQTQRPRVKDLLTIQIRKINSELIALKSEIENQSGSDQMAKEPEQKPKPKNTCYDVKITNYAWDQSDKSLKFYITLKNVHSISKDNIKCNFTERSFELVVNGLDGYNHSLLIKNLLHPIIPNDSFFKIKTDMVVLIVKKATPQNWIQITVQEKKAKDSRMPKLEESADPSHGLMDLLKQMYDDGDDDMKRTIAKAWTESREKAAGSELDF